MSGYAELGIAIGALLVAAILLCCLSTIGSNTEAKDE